MEVNKNKEIPATIPTDLFQNPEKYSLPNPHDISQQLKEARVLPTEELRPPEIAWRQSTGAILGTLGNISMVTGKAKSRKSFFINIAVSVVLKKDYLFDQFVSCLPDDKKTVLYFDTEQSRWHVLQAVKRICEQIEIKDPPNLEVYGLRKYSPGERLKIIGHAINTIPEVGFVVIDGIRDLVSSINDEDQATEISSKLMKWSEEKELHILTVLHQNKGDTNARGHLGTELQNKCETVLAVTKKDDISVVEAEFCRNREPEPFAFEIKNNLPKLVDDFEVKIKPEKEIDFDDLNDFDQFSLLNTVFSRGDSFSHGELVRQIKIAFKDVHGKNIGDNKIKRFITGCKNNGWVIQGVGMNGSTNRQPFFKGEFDNPIF